MTIRTVDTSAVGKGAGTTMDDVGFESSVPTSGFVVVGVGLFDVVGVGVTGFAVGIVAGGVATGEIADSPFPALSVYGGSK